MHATPHAALHSIARFGKLHAARYSIARFVCCTLHCTALHVWQVARDLHALAFARTHMHTHTSIDPCCTLAHIVILHIKLKSWCPPPGTQDRRSILMLCRECVFSCDLPWVPRRSRVARSSLGRAEDVFLSACRRVWRRRESLCRHGARWNPLPTRVRG